MNFLTIDQVMEKIHEEAKKHVNCQQSLSLAIVAREITEIDANVISASIRQAEKGSHKRIDLDMKQDDDANFTITSYTQFLKDTMDNIVQHYYLSDISSLNAIYLAIRGLHTSAVYVEEMSSLVQSANNIFTKRGLCGKFVHPHFKLVPDAIARIQYRLVDLEVQLRLAEEKKRVLNNERYELEQQEKEAKGTERIMLNKRIDAKKVEIEKSEEEIRLLERTKQHFQEQLDDGTINTIVG